MPNDNALLGSRDDGRPTVAVRLAVADEIDAIWRMYAEVCDDMRGKPFDVDWVMGEHPVRENLVADIEAGRLLVAVADTTPQDGHEPGRGTVGANDVLGAVVINHTQEKGYELANWSVSASGDEVAVVHLLAVAPRGRGLGVGRALLEAAADFSRARGCLSMRLDVWSTNSHAIGLYRRCGLLDKGVHRLDYGDYSPMDVTLMELPLV